MRSSSPPARSLRSPVALLAGFVGLAGCASGRPAPPPGAPPAPQNAAASERVDRASRAPTTSAPNANPFPSTYRPFPSRPTVIRNVTLMTGAGPTIRGGAILLRDGRIAAVGQTVEAPADAVVIDGAGRYVTPGIIDTHSHIGAGSAPGDQGAQTNDVNEATAPVTAHVWVEHSVWPQDAQFPRTLAGGVTTIQVLPGSANLIGGRSVTLKVVPSRSVQGMKFPGAKYGLKMACGENPKRVYAQRGPSTRMGNVAGYRAAWIQAEAYRRRWDAYLAGNRQGDPPTRDLGQETLAEVLRGNILVHNHCYRADEMMQMIDVAREFGYQIRSFHHGVEAYKIADVLARDSISGSLWADWGGFKLEAATASAPTSRSCTPPARARSSTPTTPRRAAAAPGGREGARRRPRRGARRHRGRRDPLAHREPGVGAGHRRPHRHAAGGQERRRGAVERQPVLRLHARREGVGGRRDALRPRRRPAALAHRLRARLRAGRHPRDSGRRRPPVTRRSVRPTLVALAAAGALAPRVRRPPRRPWPSSAAPYIP
jgi:imidazolonepropionase-like amidohydrolase